MRLWLHDAEVERDDMWKELRGIKYKVAESSGRLMIMPKEIMRSRGIASPDVADALALTFSRRSVLNPRAKEESALTKEFDFYKKNKGKGIFTGSRYLNK